MPFIGRKNGTLTARQQGHNDVHGWYRLHIEQLFARLWHWGLVRNIWRGGPNELHHSVRILLHVTQFCIRRQVRHPPFQWPFRGCAKGAHLAQCGYLGAWLY